MSLLRDVILTYDRLFDFQHVSTAESGCALDIGVNVAVVLNGIRRLCACIGISVRHVAHWEDSGRSHIERSGGDRSKFGAKP